MKRKTDLKESIESSLKLYEYFSNRAKNNSLTPKEINECKILKSFLQYIRTIYVYDNIKDIISDNAKFVTKRTKSSNLKYQSQIDLYELEKNSYENELNICQTKYSKLSVGGGFLSEEENSSLKTQMIKSYEQQIEALSSAMSAIEEKINEYKAKIRFNDQIVDDSINVSQNFVKKILEKEEQPTKILKSLLEEFVNGINTTTAISSCILLNPGSNNYSGMINRPFVDLCISFLTKDPSSGLYPTVLEIDTKDRLMKKNEVAIQSLPSLYTHINSLEKEIEIERQNYENKKETIKTNKKNILYVFDFNSDENELLIIENKIKELELKLSELKNSLYSIIIDCDLLHDTEFWLAVNINDNIILFENSAIMSKTKSEHIEKILEYFKRNYPHNINCSIDVLKKKNDEYGEDLSKLYESMPEEYRDLRIDDICSLKYCVESKTNDSGEGATYYEYLKLLDLLVIIDDFNGLPVEEKNEIYCFGLKKIANSSVRKYIESELQIPDKKSVK